MSWYSCKNFHECTQVCTYKLLSSRSQGRSQGGAQGARAPPLSCRAMTSYERRLATRVVTLASCKLELTVLELVVATIYHAAHKSATRLYTNPVQCSREDPALRQDQYFKGHLLVGVTYVRVAVLRAAQIIMSVL